MPPPPSAMRQVIVLLSLLVSWGASFQVTPVAHSYGNVGAGKTTSFQSTSNEVGDVTARQRHVGIEYYTGCQWMLKSFWLAQELLTTFQQDLDAVTVIPSTTKGVFSVRLNGSELLWDRQEQDRFPSPKELKRLFRDIVDPDIFLGHSDTEERQQTAGGDLSRPSQPHSAAVDSVPAPTPGIKISYCTGCRWLLRAAYFGEELLSTFDNDLKSVTLAPSRPPEPGGRFSIELDGELLFDRSTEGRFPEAKEIKEMLRERGMRSHAHNIP